MSRPEILTRETTHAGYLTVERLTIRLSDGQTALREIESHGDSVAVLPYDAARQCALVIRQFRAAVFAACGEDSVVEACAGMIDGEDAETSVRRESDEELGLELRQVEFVARIWPSPGISTERAFLYLAPYRPEDRTGPGGGLASEHEDIAVIETPLADLADDAESGRIVDAKLLVLILSLRSRRPDLFERAAPAALT